MLHPTRLRDLTLAPAQHPRGQPHLSAASGLVLAGGWLHCVADDEHHLAALPWRDGAVSGELQLHRLRGEDLPQDKQERKRLKPDLEALALLPGRLFALGSGSRANRQRGFLLPLTPGGALSGEAREVDLAPLYAPLQRRFGDLNIEGAFVADGTLCLLQRANQGQALNACVVYARDAVEQWLAGSRPAPAPQRIDEVTLGAVDGVALGFTDATAWPGGGWLFSAVAEDSQDSYQDGRCAAAVIGRVSAQGELLGMATLAAAPKVEGIAWAVPGDRLLLVTDADDPKQPSQLLALDGLAQAFAA
jgi:hypothetical protein